MELENNVFFWQKLDTLLLSSEVVIERKKATAHPKYANLIYPVDYGYFSETISSDSSEVDLFKGTKKGSTVESVIVAVDILKKDVEVKVLLGCTKEEELEILRFLNQTDFQKTILIRRGNTIPTWAESDS